MTHSSICRLYDTSTRLHDWGLQKFDHGGATNSRCPSTYPFSSKCFKNPRFPFQNFSRLFCCFEQVSAISVLITLADVIKFQSNTFRKDTCSNHETLLSICSLINWWLIEFVLRICEIQFWKSSSFFKHVISVHVFPDFSYFQTCFLLCYKSWMLCVWVSIVRPTSW